MDESVQRRETLILNTNIGYTNCINLFDEKIYDIVIQTLDLIIDILKPIYGKHAAYNLIIYDNNVTRFGTNVFTNDGINCISNLEFISPIQKYIANFIVYIGSRVDNQAYDGTTTAMLFTAIFLKKLFKLLFNLYKNYPTEIFIKKIHSYRHAIFRAFSNLNCELINNARYENISSQVLYELVLTTTKGNKKLASLISEIFSSIPKEILNVFQYGRSKIETDEDFKKVEKEEDFGFLIHSFDKTLYNDELKTKYVNEDINVLVYPGILDGAHPIHKDIVMDLIEYHHQTYPDKYLLLITLSFNAASAIKLREKYPKLITCSYSTVESILINNPLELLMLLAMTNKKNILDFKSKDENYNPTKDMLITNIKVEIDDYQIKFYNLYEVVNNYIHEYYYDETKEDYHRLLKALKDKLDELKKQHNVELVKEQYTVFQNLYKNMIAYKLPYVEIGGTTLELLSNIDLINDAKGVTMSVLNDGLIEDGLFKIYNYVHSEFNRNNEIGTIYKFIKETTLELIFPHVLQLYKNTSLYNDDTKKTLLLGRFEKIMENNNPFNFSKLSQYLNEHDKNYSVAIDIVYQPLAMYTELFKRIKELVTKFISTNYIIVPNTVAINEENKNKEN